MLLREPSRAAAVVDGAHPLRVRRERRLPFRHDRPGRLSDSAADVAPARAAAEIERELRRDRTKLLGGGPHVLRPFGGRLSRAARRDLAADAERNRPPLEQIDVHARLNAEAGAGQLREHHVPALGELEIARKARHGRVKIDDERSDFRRRLLGERGNSEGQQAEDSSDAHSSDHIVLVSERPPLDLQATDAGVPADPRRRRGAIRRACGAPRDLHFGIRPGRLSIDA